VSSFDARLEQERIHSRKLVGGCLEGFSIKKVEVKSLMRILCLLGGVIILDLVCIRRVLSCPQSAIIQSATSLLRTRIRLVFGRSLLCSLESLLSPLPAFLF
jgi:hypothetical protein